MQARTRELVLIGAVGGAAGLLAVYPREASEGCFSGVAYTNLLTGGQVAFLAAWAVTLVAAACFGLVSVALNRRLRDAVAAVPRWVKGTLVLGVLAAAYGGRLLGDWWFAVAGFSIVDRECWVGPGDAFMGGGMQWTNAAGHTFTTRPEPLLGSIAAAVAIGILFAGVWCAAVLRLTRNSETVGSPAAA
jgi:hypothetical protein